MGRKAGELLVLGILKSLKKQSEKLNKGNVGKKGMLYKEMFVTCSRKEIEISVEFMQVIGSLVFRVSISQKTYDFFFYKNAEHYFEYVESGIIW